MRIAVCDDDPAFLARVAHLIDSRLMASHPPLNPVATFLDGDSLIRAHAAHAFDVIFLDVVMPLANGIDIAREIRATDRDVKIVFLTSSAEFAVDSYTVKASNYLLKPVDSTALFRCLEELAAETNASQRRIAIKTAYSARSISPAAIEYLEARGRHVELFLTNGESIESVEPFGTVKDKLVIEDGFFQCHRSYIVNINHIDTYASEGLTMRSGHFVPVSRSCRATFKEAYFTVLFGEEGGASW